ncbi:MAG: hypothetical protein M1820_004345 [Bogoriella megaspora]|nr:MAG: hypothetical protein M1820_004345 [Bogoriella megaspora]
MAARRSKAKKRPSHSARKKLRKEKIERRRQQQKEQHGSRRSRPSQKKRKAWQRDQRLKNKRFPPTFSSSSSTASDVDALIAKSYGDHPQSLYEDSNGDPIRPFSILSYTYDLFAPFITFSEAILDQPGLLPRMRELAVLAVTAVHPTPFVAHAHSRIATGLVTPLLTKQTDDARKGITPSGLHEKEGVAYETALLMAKGIGTLSEAEWKRGEIALGKEGMARLGQIVGFYLYACCLMRLGEEGVPKSG